MRLGGVRLNVSWRDVGWASGAGWSSSRWLFTAVVFSSGLGKGVHWMGEVGWMVLCGRGVFIRSGPAYRVGGR